MKTTVITMGTLVRKQTFKDLRKVTLAFKEHIDDKLISRYLSGIVARTIPDGIFDDMKEGNVFLANGTLSFSKYEDAEGRKKTSLEPNYVNVVPVCSDDLAFETDNSGNAVLVGGINEVTIEGGLTKDVEFKTLSKGAVDYQLLVGRVVWEQEIPRGRDTLVRKHYATFELWGDEAVRYATLAKGQRVVIRGGIVNDSFEGENGEKVYVTKIGAKVLIPCERNFRGTVAHVANHTDTHHEGGADASAEDITGVI